MLLRWKLRLGSMFLGLSLLPLAAQEPDAKNTVVIDDDGTVHVPAQVVPMSGFLSPEAKAYVTQHLKDMQNPQVLAQDNGVPRFMKGYLERQKVLYPVDREETKIAGVHAYVYTPKAGISAVNRDRVLIDLHGGGFSGCWPGCAELESIPIAALGKIRVITLDYREGPKYKFPAASEDVAAVYRQLLKDHAPQNIGIYGCSAGGMLTAMSVAWFEKHNLPRPGAVGIFCAGAGSPTGAGFVAMRPTRPGHWARRGSWRRRQSRTLGKRSPTRTGLPRRNRSEGSARGPDQLAANSGKVSANIDYHSHSRLRNERRALYPHAVGEAGSRRRAARLGSTVPWILL